MRLAFQDTNIEFGELEQINNALSELNADHISFGLIPFTNIVSTGDEWIESTIMMGSTKLAKLCLRGVLPKYGIIFYDERKFDQSYYIRYLKSELLNSDAEFFKYGLIKDVVYTYECFIKPSSDLKYFAGTVLYPCDNTISSELEKVRIIDCDLSDDTWILVNKYVINNIQFEYRAFIINNEIIDCCQYIKNKKVTPRVLADDIRSELYAYIDKIQEIYSPHDHYVIDIAELDDGTFKVIEYNCINCSGVYVNNRALIYKKLMEII